MVGQLTHRRGAARPMRRAENLKPARSNYENVKRRIVAKAVNQARRNGVRPNLRKPDEERDDRPRGPAPRANRTAESPPRISRGPGPPLRERRSTVISPLPPLPPQKRYPGRRGKRGGRRRGGAPVPKNTARNGSRDEKRPVVRAAAESPRLIRRSPHPPSNERRIAPPRHSPDLHPYPVREEPPRRIRPNHQKPARRSIERAPLPPRGREDIRFHRDAPISPPDKGPMLFARFRDAAPRGRPVPESNRLMPSISEREAMLRRARSPLRNKRPSRSEREDDFPKRPRDGPSRPAERGYGYMVESHHRMIHRDLEDLHRRPAGDRRPPYPGRGMDRPPVGLDYPPRTRSISPPPMRIAKGYPPRGRIHDLDNNYRLMRSGRREDYPHGREPLPPSSYELGRERVRMDPFGDYRVRMLPSRRSMEREMERREREWRPSPLGRPSGPPMPARGRSAERNPRYNMHFDPLSRR